MQNTYTKEVQSLVTACEGAIKKIAFGDLQSREKDKNLAQVERNVGLIINIHISFLHATPFEDKSLNIIYELCDKFMEYGYYLYVSKLIFLFHGIRYDILEEYIKKI